MSLDPPRIKVALNLAPARTASLIEFARRAEDSAYDSVWVSDHVALATDGTDIMNRYGRMLYLPHADFPAPLIALAAIAQATQRIRVGVAVLILPLREPIALAREIATLDVLTNGRLDVGMGVGWNENEARSVGADFRRRGARADEMLDVIRTLFTADEPEHHGEFFDFGPIGFEPRPTRANGPKFLIGGTSEAALRRAVERGDGWLAAGPIDTVIETAARMRRRRDQRGSEGPFDITVQMMDLLPDRDDLDRLADAGIDRVIVVPWPDDGQPRLGAVSADRSDAIESYAASIGLTN
jgi:probable F420-dependent oxidoreductase